MRARARRRLELARVCSHVPCGLDDKIHFFKHLHSNALHTAFTRFPGRAGPRATCACGMVHGWILDGPGLSALVSAWYTSHYGSFSRALVSRICGMRIF